MDEPIGELQALSGINEKGEGFVQLRTAGARVPGVVADAPVLLSQMTPAEARNFAQNVMEAAEAAETDAFMWHFFKARMKLDTHTVAGFLGDFRKWRESQGGVKAPTLEDFTSKATREKLGL